MDMPSAGFQKAPVRSIKIPDIANLPTISCQDMQPTDERLSY
jgi:hypothetical protein